MAQDNKTLVHSAFDAINKGDLAKFKEHLDPKLHHLYQDAFQRVRHAFPDMRLTIDDIVAEGDRVIVHWIFQGTHKGEAADFRIGAVKPTGRPVRVSGFTRLKIANGKVVETSGENDQLSALQQLGLLTHFATTMERLAAHPR